MEQFNYYALRLDSRASCLIIERFMDGQLQDTDILSGRIDAIEANATAVVRNKQLIRDGKHVSCSCRHCGEPIAPVIDPWGGEHGWIHHVDDGPDAYTQCGDAFGTEAEPRGPEAFFTPGGES